MPRENTTATTSTTTRTLERQTQRVTSLEPREGHRLTSLEEAVVRMHHGISLKPEACLSTNGVTDDLMAELLHMEIRAFELSGQIDHLDDIPEGAPLDGNLDNERTRRIVRALQQKS